MGATIAAGKEGKVMREILSLTFITALLAAALRLSIPILFAGLGGMFSERSGIINIGLEGMMLSGALAGVVGSYQTGSPWIGILYAMLAGGLLALLHAYFTITLQVDQVVSGIAINILSMGITSFFFRLLFGITTTPIKVNSFQPIHLPMVSDIPVIGPVFFSQNILVYIALFLVPVSHYILFKTTWGLSIRTVGEHPQAASTVGIPVFKIRYICTVLGGVLAGLGGSFLSLGQFNMFVDNMIAGRGFIAVAAIIFGKWQPLGVLGASLVFGAADAIQVRLQTAGLAIPYQFFLMFPYILTIIALTGLVGRTIPPAAEGRPYTTE